VNVADARHELHAPSAAFIEFQPEDPAQHFDDTGVNITVLQPGKPNGRYHAESVQEDFLVLHGECLLLMNDEEIRLKTWDYVHCPPGVSHIFVGLDAPCAVLMIGARRPDSTVHYPVNELAAKYDASAAFDTDDPAEAYADWERESVPVRLPWPMERT
jgi:uncharacterized cupin superfamily protein